MNTPSESKPGGDSMSARMAKGGGAFGSGMLMSRFLQFVNTLIVVRIISRADYGIISTANAVIGIVVIVSLLGFNAGVSRYIPKHKAGKNNALLGRILCTAIVIVGVSSCIAATALFFLTPRIAVALNQERLPAALTFFASLVVPESIIYLLGAVFRGLQRPKQSIASAELTVSLVRLALLLACLAAGDVHFWGIVAAYVIAGWAGMVAILGYCYRYFRGLGREFVFDRGIARDLLIFSVPLLGFNMLGISINWVVSLILAHFQPAEQVGLLTATQRLTQFIGLPLGALVFMYLPIVTGLNESGKIDEIRRMYVSVAKWATLLTLPVALMLALDGTYVATLLLGNKYHDAGAMLALMTIGMFVQTLFGPNGVTLISMGEYRSLLVSNVIGMILIVLSCLLLVPQHGAIGAAIAIAVGLVGSNVFRTVFLVVRRNIHPFRYEFIAPLAFAIAASLLSSYVLKSLPAPGHLMHLANFVLITLFTMVSMFATRSFSTEDIEVLGLLERKFLASERLSTYLAKRLKSG